MFLPDLKRIQAARVLVIGDVMLDRYWFGEVERISPEAPVPVVKIDHRDERPGGAANVACNVAALGATASLLSVVGEDEPAVVLRQLLTKAGIQCGFQQDKTVTTTVKLRIIGRQQQLLRVDFEVPPTRETLSAKLNDFVAKLPTQDAVVFSDYGKGGLLHIEAMIRQARAMGKPVLIDPKGDDYAKYYGATILTPNRSEFRQIVGAWRTEEELTAKAQRLRTELNLTALLVTRSEEGMTLFSEAAVHHIPAQSREVYDVTGAGDTVIATLGVFLAAGVDLLTATQLANRAAGIVVEKLGTASVSMAELFADSNELAHL